MDENFNGKSCRSASVSGARKEMSSEEETTLSTLTTSMFPSQALRRERREFKIICNMLWKISAMSRSV